MGEKTKKDKKKKKPDENISGEKTGEKLEKTKKKKKDDENEKRADKSDKKKKKDGEIKDRKKEKKKKDVAVKNGDAKKKKKKEKDAKKKDKKKKEKKQKKDKKKKKHKLESKKKKKKQSSKKKTKKVKIDTVCCICKDETAEISAGGLCSHVFSKSCLENLLHRPIQNPQEDDNHLAAPTLGRCPMCHVELRQFEMKNPKTGKLSYERDTNIKKAPIYGKVYRPKNPDMQLGDFCFDAERPYMDFAAAIEKEGDLWLLNDGNRVPDRMDFKSGSFFDAKTRSFHGSIDFDPVQFQGAYRWDVVLSFDPKFEDIKVGLIHERKERVLSEKELSKLDNAEIHRHLYPLDGEWKLVWLDQSGKEKTGNITVRNNEFQQGPYLFNINFDEPDTPRFRWPLDPVFAAAKKGVNLKKKPTGPKVGGSIVWETTHPAFREITWKRESIGGNPIQRTVHFGAGDNDYTSVEKKEDNSDKSSTKSATSGSSKEQTARDTKESDGSSDSSSSIGSSDDESEKKTKEKANNSDSSSSSDSLDEVESKKPAPRSIEKKDSSDSSDEDSSDSESEEDVGKQTPAASPKDDSDSSDDSSSSSGSDDAKPEANQSAKSAKKEDSDSSSDSGSDSSSGSSSSDSSSGSDSSDSS